MVAVETYLLMVGDSKAAQTDVFAVIQVGLVRGRFVEIKTASQARATVDYGLGQTGSIGYYKALWCTVLGNVLLAVVLYTRFANVLLDSDANPCIALLDCLVRGFLSEAAEKNLYSGEFRRGSGTTNLNVLVVVLSQTLTPAQTLQFEPIPKAIGGGLTVLLQFRFLPYDFGSSQYSTSTRPGRAFAVTLG
ncbi:hypothetical protein R3P38DRAFT_2814845 [Favolaschia claudopus]|uniref:Uncharacterized protein n=1 Tax=Favolaschia claudopus TaxID=2862362 RepID=A0AAV9Z245_9AGAR